MIVLPVIERELRVAARSRRTYRQRFIAAFVAIFMTIFLFIRLHGLGVPEVALGSDIFQAITRTAMIASLLAGVLETADAISQERREGTLGLLYLTDLKSSHVLAGKLAALSIPSFFALATIVPIIGIPVLLGGVSPANLAYTPPALLSGLALSLSAGIFCSCLSKDDRTTRIVTFILLLFPTVIFPLADEHRANPLQTLWLVTDRSRKIPFDEYWGSLSVQFAISFFLVAVASLLSRAHWREQPVSMPWIRIRDRFVRLFQLNPDTRKRRRTEGLDDNPAFWLSSRKKAGPILLWMAILGTAACCGFEWWRVRHIDEFVFVPILYLLHLALKVCLAMAAADPVGDGGDRGGIELLLTTPFTPQRLFEGHAFGVMKNFGPPAFIIAAVTIAIGVVGRYDFVEDFHELLRVGGVFLLIDAVAIWIYATWLGLKLKRPGKAAVRTLFWVVIVPDALFPILRSLHSGISFVIIWSAIDLLLIGNALPKLWRFRASTSE